jgi:transposase
MLADQLDCVVGVDPHRDSHALAVVDVRTGAVVFEADVAANSDGYRQALVLGQEHAPGRRVFAVEGTGSFGAGLTRFLTAGGERVLEVGRPRRERRTGGKTDALDAVPAVCSPTSGLRRHGQAVNARRCRRWWPHGKARSTPSVPVSASCEIC